ncbi:CopL family metal-binding regulatory protein [Alkalisalibacterium limincola]|uniref:CopL family metal-binding regulatory protein n=1 Tax=Alkalisalibacterium limincola TaxID=2699169 RepID=A0A5C8KZY5_9GAMM|nr:CopL family metal-binding regulatory protein [Alkalisalibacterium limincola]TXK65711.1 CopL family metal-binding regulatory protein [Alkalisalibacterium limincola]
MSAAPRSPDGATALARWRAAAYTAAMPVSLATVARLMLVLALAFNGWALPAHAHASMSAAAASSDQAAGVGDCHQHAKAPAGTATDAGTECCATGSCQGCSCVMACATALPVAGASGTQWAASKAPLAGPVDAPGTCPSGNPLRPPIA